MANMFFNAVLEFLEFGDTANTLERGDDTFSRVPIDNGFPTFNAQDPPQTDAYVRACACYR